MSTFSGIGGKGDKGSNKYKSLNINNIYQGKSVPTQKSTGKQFTFNRKKCKIFLYQILKKVSKSLRKIRFMRFRNIYLFSLDLYETDIKP